MLPLKEFVQNRYNKSIAECSNEELYLALLNYSKLASSQKPVNTGKKNIDDEELRNISKLLRKEFF